LSKPIREEWATGRRKLLIGEAGLTWFVNVHG
jgi:hypothetical protein